MEDNSCLLILSPQLAVVSFYTASTTGDTLQVLLNFMTFLSQTLYELLRLPKSRTHDATKHRRDPKQKSEKGSFS